MVLKKLLEDFYVCIILVIICPSIEWLFNLIVTSLLHPFSILNDMRLSYPFACLLTLFLQLFFLKYDFLLYRSLIVWLLRGDVKPHDGVFFINEETRETGFPIFY